MQYHTESSGPDADAFARALAYALNLAQSCDCKDVIFLTPTLKNLDGVPKDVMGSIAIKSLIKKRVISENGVNIHLETERTVSSPKQAIVFAPFVSPKLLAKAIGDFRMVDLVYVPWTPQELAAYKAAHPASIVI